ncbi:hypothetical protein [Falsirhodobacter halotolerans]|uniref:hypothetical protein n=1 Tax=Falsirhodobacter halotolerans TaxID=1146892 RepID=UPI001FD4F33E|nr:hypothetical protein [Falsirhodobacter halotolerans]MCJ8141057.1 hypothetical protein [Falsirhodobacter halotolerans]
MPPEHSTDKASVEDRLLASIDLVDAGQACTLLRIDADDAESAIQALALDDAIITLVQNGRNMVPLFQFDTANNRLFDVVRAILQVRPPHISNLRLVYWMTRAHVDFRCAPAQRFGKNDAAIVGAFRRYIEPESHG